MRRLQPLDPSELIAQLGSSMNAANLEWENTRAWTTALKDCLRVLLEREGNTVTDVLYSHRETHRHEFLLDIVVWDRSDGEGVTLAVESEWEQNLEAVAEDFWKLLVVKAPTKLMIFACNKRPRAFAEDAIWDKLSNCLLRYRDHMKGERYIFMNYAPPPGRRAWWIEIPTDGKLQAIPDRKWIELQ